MIKLMQDSKEITLCPICLKSTKQIKSAVYCPREGGAAVCMEHCFKGCGYMEQSISLQRCTYKDNKGRDAGHKKISLH